MTTPKHMDYPQVDIYFKQTGERFYPTILSHWTVEQMIRYVCDNSIIKDKIDWQDYYLYSLKKDEILQKYDTLEKLNVMNDEIHQFYLCMKTDIRQRMFAQARERLHANSDKITIDDDENSVDCVSSNPGVAEVPEDLGKNVTISISNLPM